MEPITLNLPDGFAALNEASANKNSRYAINGVWVAGIGGKVNMAATDGHWLAYLKGWRHHGMQSVPAFSVIVPGQIVKKIKPAKRGESPARLIIDDDGQRIVAPDGAIHPFEPVDGNFPPVDAVVPDFETDTRDIAMTFGVNADFIGKVGKIAKRFHPEGQPRVALSHRAANRPMIAEIRTEQADSLQCVIMPINID